MNVVRAAFEQLGWNMTPVNTLEEQLEALKMQERANARAFEDSEREIERLREQLKAAQRALRELHEEMWTVRDDDEPEYVSDEGLKYLRGWFERTNHLLGEASTPASGRTISATITGDGSGVALPLITEGFGPPRTWNPSGGAGSSTASSADDAGAEEPSPASDPFDAGGQVTHVHDPASRQS